MRSAGRLGIAFLLGIAVCSPLQACESEAGSGAKLKIEISLKWEGKSDNRRLVIEYSIRNDGPEEKTYEFRNSGRLCGEIRDSKGKEIYSFPQMTAQVMGRETIKPGKTRTFIHKIPRAEFGDASPGTYELHARLCGQEGLSRVRKFDLPPQ